MKGDVSSAFRRVLARELPGWKADGLIDETASAALVRRYQLDRLAESQRGWATSAFAILGAVAVGAGIISFVAANWAAIDSAARFAIVFGATIVAYGAAFALRAHGRHTLADAAFVAAALGFGGSIALSAQQFNFSLSTWHVYALWAVGLVPLALVLRSLAVATLALAVGTIWLPVHAIEAFGDTAPSMLLFTHLAVLAVLATLLSRRLGVLWFRELTLGVVALSLMLAIAQSSLLSRASAIGIAAALVLAVGVGRSRMLRVIGGVTAFLAAAPSTFWWAYSEDAAFLAAGGPLVPVAILLLAAAVAAVFLVHGRAALAFLPPGVAVALVILLPHVGRVPPLTGVLIANALILAPAVMLIARGVSLRDRTAFLCGTAACAIVGFLRFAEYDHNLTAKAVAFLLVGIAFIGAALVFEREQPAAEPAHAA